VSIDERIKDQLRSGGPQYPDPPDLTALAGVIRRRRRRRRIRTSATLAATALIAAAAIVIPSVWLKTSPDSKPAVGPTTQVRTSERATNSKPTGSSNTSTALTPVSPIDGLTWTTIAANRSDWLASLDGTDVAAYGPQVYQAARLNGQPMSVSIQRGQVTVRTGIAMHNPSLIEMGTVRVVGNHAVFDLEHLGRSVYAWTVNRQDQLQLTYLAGTDKEYFGAPAEVLLRMVLTSKPFTKRLGY
jgi:hypothetical protein